MDFLEGKLDLTGTGDSLYLSRVREELIFFCIPLPQSLKCIWDADFSSTKLPLAPNDHSIIKIYPFYQAQPTDQTVSAKGSISLTIFQLKIIGSFTTLKVGFCFPASSGTSFLVVMVDVPNSTSQEKEQKELRVAYNHANQAVETSLSSRSARKSYEFVLQNSASWSLQPSTDAAVQAGLNANPSLYPFVHCVAQNLTITLIN